MATETLTREEICRRGQQIVDGLPEDVKRQCDGQPIVVDVVSGDYEIAPRRYDATQRLRSRHPQAIGYWGRVGDDVADRIGSVRKARTT